MFAEVFNGHDFYSHMPFLFEESETINMLFSKVDYEDERDPRRWKLHTCILDDMLQPQDIQRLNTGLGDEYIECNPSIYINGNNELVLTFIAGKPIPNAPTRYRAYQMTGYSIDDLSEAQVVSVEPYIKPWSACQTLHYNAVCGVVLHSLESSFINKKTIAIRNKNDNSVIHLNLDVDNILRVSSIYGSANKILITARSDQFTYRFKTFVYDIEADVLYDTRNDVNLDNNYKGSVYKNMYAYAQRSDSGFENRSICVIDEFQMPVSSLSYERISV